MFAVVLKNHPVGLILMLRFLTLYSFAPSLTSTTRASSEALRGIYATPETEVSSYFLPQDFCTNFLMCFSCCCFHG